MIKSCSFTKNESGCSAAWLRPTHCNPMDCSPLGSSVYGIFHASILELVAISYSRGSSQPRDLTQVFCTSCIGRWILYHWSTWEAWSILNLIKKNNFERNLITVSVISFEIRCIKAISQLQWLNIDLAFVVVIVVTLGVYNFRSYIIASIPLICN